MLFTRRDFMCMAAASAASCIVPDAANAAPRRTRIKAIAFDAFPIFDPRPVAMLAQKMLPEHGVDLMNAWRTRQFEYTWLRVAARQYVDFRRISEDALTYA